ncbi:hypothetical protein BC936DRAFT_146300 [Jimgerdemannia flammicorona]|uniref:UBZ4-type domain-containing protein n=1 Tax=Jimgerdemannia flammicorona TaxID=994334 RepID=A0A433DLP1_9FUNG|nr:hypothetical protein BC936DRAFT_146300 [Jimgerdemannia flammicorona]
MRSTTTVRICGNVIPPQPADRWWLEHQQSCGGTFHKIAEPEKKAGEVAGKGKRRVIDDGGGNKNIMDFFKKAENGDGEKIEKNGRKRRKVGEDVVAGKHYETPDSDEGLRWGGGTNRVDLKDKAMVQCPVCGKKVADVKVNDHVDLCLWMAEEKRKEGTEMD